MKKIILLLFCAVAPALWATGAGLPGNFLTEPVGARARGMAGAFTAVADDASAAWFNPSGLSLLRYKEFTGFTRELWEDTQMSYVAYCYPTKKIGSFGLQVFDLTSEHYEKRETKWEDPSEFSFGTKVLAVSYGRRFFKKYHAGLNLKMINKTMLSHSGSGIGLDMGFLYEFEFAGVSFWKKHLNRMRAGLNIQNVFPPSITMFEKSERFKPNFALGFSYKLDNVFTPVRDGLTAALDFSRPAGMNVITSVGCEYRYKNLLALRAGLRSNHIAMGMGIKYGQFQFDFSFDTHELGNKGQISLTGRFGLPVGEGPSARSEYSRWRARREANNYYKKGLAYYEKGKLADALSEWEKALVWEPDNEDVLKNVEKARGELERDVSRKLIEKRIALAYGFYGEGNLLNSLDEWKEVAKLDPANKSAGNYISRIKEKLSARDEKIYTERQKEKRKKEIVSLLMEGDKFYDEGEYLKAIEAWEKVLKIDRKQNAAEENIKEAKAKLNEIKNEILKQGRQYYGQKKYGEAARKFRRAVKIDPGNKTALGFLDKIEKDIGEQKAQIPRKEIDEMYYEAADLYLKGSYSEAGKIVENLITRDPANKNAYKLLERIESVLKVMEKR